MSLKDLLEFLKSDVCSTLQYWKDQIEKTDPDWRDIFRNPENWKELEKVCKPSDYLDNFEYSILDRSFYEK